MVREAGIKITDRGAERETVWLAILIAAEEGIGTHHVELFCKAGGSQAQAEHLTKLCAFAMGSEAFAFIDKHWSSSFPVLAGHKAYLVAFDGLQDDSTIPGTLCHLAMAALQATLGRAWALEAHIKALYQLGGLEDALAEALSLIMWPVGVNHFLDACGVWSSMMANGTVTPSPRYRVWAETPDQDGHRLR